ncbi:hypothetical protein RJT34_16541 [Clitoria ternatea]|uniref:Uncharacterized protein n=1 Tax=Clitoria ternatea TaxID=43366 RepID=A0AAN9J8I8_CLITE
MGDSSLNLVFGSVVAFAVFWNGEEGKTKTKVLFLRCDTRNEPCEFSDERSVTKENEQENRRDCFNGRVRKLVLERCNLTGALDSKILNRLDQLRVLSFKGNSLSGQIPDLSPLINLKSVFLNDNNFSGVFPASVTVLHRVKNKTTNKQ